MKNPFQRLSMANMAVNALFNGDCGCNIPNYGNARQGGYNGGGGGNMMREIGSGIMVGSPGTPIAVTQIPPGGAAYLVPVPNFDPACISSLVFTTTLAGGVTTAYLDDFTGIAAQLGQLPGATFQPFTGPGLLTPENLKKWLATRALFVNGFNLQSTVAADVQKSLNLRYMNLDGTFTPAIISNSMYTQAINPTTTLVNNPNGWVWMDNTVVLVSGTPGATLTLTVNIGASAAYTSPSWNNYRLPQGSAVCAS